MSEHAPFAPSAAERWLACPGSWAAERAAGPRTGSMYADEGSAAHALFADALRSNVSPYSLTADSYIAKPLHEAWLAAKQLIAGRRFLVERRLPAMPGMPDLWGTADVIVFDRFGRVVMVIDLKFGSGVIVEPDAAQLLIYALLAAQQYGGSPDGITAAILQPRALHEMGPVRTHHHTTDALSEGWRQVQAGLLAAQEPDAPRSSGLHCRFCAVKYSCPVRHHSLPQVSHSPWHQGRPTA
jgi:hypothetical protein